MLNGLPTKNVDHDHHMKEAFTPNYVTSEGYTVRVLF